MDLPTNNIICRDFLNFFRPSNSTKDFSQFIRFMGRFREDAVAYHGIRYGKFVLSKTRLMSHIKFLGSCLRIHHIPSGFQVSIRGHDSHMGSLDSHLRRCSFKLMRDTLRKHVARIHESTQRLLSHKKALRELLNDEFYYGILSVVRRVNNRTHNKLVEKKKRKLPQLTQRSSSAPVQALHSHSQVVCIPGDMPLDDHERSVLSHGLSYCPTPHYTDSYDLERDIAAFHRRIQLKAHFHDHVNNTSAHPALPITPVSQIIDTVAPKRSNWNPPPSHNPHITQFIAASNQLFRRFNHTRSTSNLSQLELEALTRLSKRNDIVIKPADKGGATVVWERTLYTDECMRLLSNALHYRRIPGDPTVDYQREVSDTITELIRDDKLPCQARKLIVHEPRGAVFYCLPKIHKANNPGRPIVSTVNCPTSLISAFVDSICQPIVRQTDSYIKDTNHTLSLLEDFRFSGRHRIIITGDITNLYTVIDHGKGLRALRYFLDKRAVQEPSTDVVVRLAELVLRLNAFEFNSQHFQQVCGVAMGTRMGPSFACLYLAFLEQNFLAKYKGPKPDFFRRYIDDLALIFSCTPRQAKLFINKFSQLDPDLHFTWSEMAESNVPFLDLSLSASGNRITTSVYSKPTDTHSYLLYSSFHPRSLMESIPYSQFLRLRRICSEEDDFHTQCQTYANYFSQRGYPNPLIQEAISRASSKDRLHLINNTNRRIRSEKLPLVVTHTPMTSTMAPRIADLFDRMLVRNPATAAMFPARPIKAFRKPKSLRSILVRARLRDTTPNDPNPGTFPCNRSQCSTCSHTLRTHNLQTSRASFHIKDHFTCQSQSVIYAITCVKCPGAIYVGQTGRTLAVRFREHLYSVNNNTGISEVSNHFSGPNHNRDDMKITALLHAPRIESARLELESRIIHRFQAHIRPGLNNSLIFT